MNNDYLDDELNEDINEEIDLSIYEDDKPSKKKPKFILPIIAAVILIVVLIGVIATRSKDFIFPVMQAKPNTTIVDLHDYYGVSEGSVSFIYRNELLNVITKVDGQYYLEMNFVYDNICNNFYYDASLDKLLYTTGTEIRSYTFDSLSYDVNGKSATGEYVVAHREDDKIFIALDFIKDKGPYVFMEFPNPERVVMVDDGTTVDVIEIAKGAVIRTGTSIIEPILSDNLDGLWSIVDEDCDDGWTCVSHVDGRRGYIDSDSLINSDKEEILSSGYQPEVYKDCLRDYEIMLVWHPIYYKNANKNINGLLQKTHGVTTVSPTWYKVSNETGGLLSMADRNYVKYVQGLGMEVWPLISDFTSTDGAGWSHKELFSNATNRRNLINNIIKEIKYLGCEGVNIDFERITSDDKLDYAQFIRELSVSCRKENIVLSVDVMVPTSYNMKYNYDVLGEFVDYIMIMGYDEYYSGCGQAGPNASLPFEKAGIENGLKYMPANKILSGVPFYTRMWIESVNANGEKVLEAKTYYMQTALDAVEKLKLNKTWNEELQVYAAYGTVDGVHYRIWLEEERSMTAKIQLVDDYKLGGVAAWALGMEIPSIWNILDR